MAAMCSFKDLVLDANDVPAVASFWAGVLGREIHTHEDGDVHLTPPGGAPDAGLTWIEAVPEPRTAKTRVHLDLRLPAPDPAPLVAAGATLLREPDDEVRWWVLADPEGNAFCAMPPAPPEWGLPGVDVPTPFELVVDAADPVAIASWWARVTGASLGERPGSPFRWLEEVPGFPFRYWVFAPVPEPKTVKNRLHWDVRLHDADPAGLIAAGATLLREPDDEIRWWVLADPEGNEFCADPPG